MTGDDVRAAAEACAAALVPHVERDWSALPVPGLDFTVAGVVAHGVEGPLWYAVDLTAGRQELDAIHPAVDAAAAPADLLAAMAVAADLFAAAVAAAPADARGFHPYGWSDPAGFAAMSCDELLVHTDDACRGLGASFVPPPALAQAVLGRLFPWVGPAAGEDPWALLRWANARIELRGRARVADGWRWQAAPVDEWDGVAPEAYGRSS